MTIHSPEALIEDIRQGKMIILMDDEDRENEGDLIMAAEYVTPEAVNFMATHGRGLICLTMTKEKCEHLGLGPMVQNGDNGSQFGTNFTVSIEAATGVTTGISAADRATTIQAAVAPNASAQDLVQPGHIFPLAAQDGGVLVRAGHTEAGCDLARIAGLIPSAVIVEILNENGSMARRPDLEVFAAKHQLKLGTVADLIEYRSHNETTIERITECKLPTEFGEFNLITYQDSISHQLHYALLKGDIPTHSCLVRVHLENHFKDILHSQRDSGSTWTLAKSMQRIAQEGGVLVILGQEISQQQTIQQLKSYAEQDQGAPKKACKPQGTSRQIGLGSQILVDLGIKSMRLLSSPDRHYHSLGGFGLSIDEYIES